MVMLLLPLSTFYFLFYIVFEKNNDMLGWCGIAAVIAANLVIASYVMMAWAEDKQEFSQKRALGTDKTRVD
jgi:VMA21-like domain